MRYLRFQLLISTGPSGGYTVHALTPKGEGRARFNLPFPPAVAAAAWRQSVRAGRDLHSSQVVSGLSPEVLGEKLFRALFQDEILRLYERSVDLLDADHPEIGLRLELMLDPRDGDLATLGMLPWELLRQPDTPEFLALLRLRPVVRYLMSAHPVYAAPQPAKIRILAVAAGPRRLPPLDLARELVNLRRAVSKAAGVEVVTPRSPHPDRHCAKLSATKSATSFTSWGTAALRQRLRRKKSSSSRPRTARKPQCEEQTWRHALDISFLAARRSQRVRIEQDCSAEGDRRG